MLLALWVLTVSAALLAIGLAIAFRKLFRFTRETRHKVEEALRAAEDLEQQTLEQSAAIRNISPADFTGISSAVTGVSREVAMITRDLPLVREMYYFLGHNEIHAVVSFPKTGGTTLIATLANLFPEKALPFVPFNTHLLTPPSQSLSAFFEGVLAFTAATPWSELDDFFPTAWDKKLGIGHAHRRLLHQRGCLPLDVSQLRTGNCRRRGPEPVINYIFSVRDPVATCFSLLFQFVSTWKRWENLSDDALLDYLRNTTGPPLIPSAPACPWPLMQQTWWREQIEQVFGVDFLTLDFDRERGWHVYDFGSLRFLVVRLENFDRLPQALSAFYDLPPQRVRVLSSNIGEAKGLHGERYQQLRPRVRIPAAVLDLAYGSRFARHFYTATELESFRLKWKL